MTVAFEIEVHECANCRAYCTEDGADYPASVECVLCGETWCVDCVASRWGDADVCPECEAAETSGEEGGL